MAHLRVVPGGAKVEAASQSSRWLFLLSKTAAVLQSAPTEHGA